MKRSTDRILTTHTGSLPRPPELIDLLSEKEFGRPYDAAVFDSKVREAVAEVVRKQTEAGIDIISDGEQGKPSYATYIKDRVTGFGGQSQPAFRSPFGEAQDFPEFSDRRAAATSPFLQRPSCDGPIEWKDFAAVQGDIENLKAASADAGASEVFMSAASPGVIAIFLGNDYFPTHEAYIEALARVMKDEYNAIHEAGFLLQLDCPDLAMSRHNRFADKSIEDFREIVALHVDTINEATKDIPPEDMRLHLCWGNYEGPHHLDVPLKDIIDIVLTARPAAISFEGANPRHEHEWSIWQEVKLPPGKVIVPGVIDSTTNFIEHPELVAQRIIRYAEVVGRENVIAGSDCGFGTSAVSNTVDPRIAWAKLAAMVEGAKIASRELWS
jgi:5-methyltetrahydropteroyltriglutamate--homocysteine methyltransferase